MINNAFYFILKALRSKKFTFLFCLFGYVGKRLDNKAKVSFKIHDVTN